MYPGASTNGAWSLNQIKYSGPIVRSNNLSRRSIFSMPRRTPYVPTLKEGPTARTGYSENPYDKGNLVYNATDEITVTIEGPARLLGLESGSLTSHEDYRANKRKAVHGKLLAYIQTTQKPGDIKITFEAEGLAPQVVNLVSN